jgi:uncharacterized protein (TIGR00730 family)
MARICVFCGTSPGRDPLYELATRQAARLISENGHTLVFGGSSAGLLGALVDEAEKLNTEITGVISRELVAMGAAHPFLRDLRVVRSLEERSQLMIDLSDAFVALPGGLGTYGEIFDVWVKLQLGLHKKPLCLVNINGYYSPLIDVFDGAVREGFVRKEHSGLLVVTTVVDGILESLAAANPIDVPKWIDGKTH